MASAVDTRLDENDKQSNWMEKLAKRIFGSVVVVAFQITFRIKMQVNDVFLFFKNYFWHQQIKTIKKIKKKFKIKKKYKF